MRTALVSGLLVAAVALFSVGAVVAAPISPIDWQRLLGGDITEVEHSVQQTADGGYILLGFSLSRARTGP